jgi:tRNA dimethylallyltransferase
MSEHPSTLFLLVGPTSVGKSRIAEEVALSMGAEILVADSRQVYRGMDIGMDKPSPAAQRRVRRHLIDLAPPDALFSAGAYRRVAEEKISEMTAARTAFLIEGGTGLYIRALLDGLWEGPPADWELRRQLRAQEEAEGAGVLHRRLSEVDPEAAETIAPRDLPRIIRALEVRRLTGRTLSDWHQTHRAKRLRRPCTIIGLRRERDDLYRRVEARVDRQIAAGLVEETRRFAHLSPDLPSMRGLGYRQMLPHVRGEQSLDEAVTYLKRDTRHYAKRQMTWFSADPKILWLDLAENEPVETTVARVHDFLNRDRDTQRRCNA